MQEIKHVVYFNDLLYKQRQLAFLSGSSYQNSICEVSTVSINSSNSSIFYSIRQLLTERFFEDSFSSVTSLSYFSIPAKYLGLGLSSSPMIIGTSLSSNYFNTFNLSSSINNYYWSSVNHKNSSDYRIAVIEDANAVNTPNANMIKNSFGYTNMDFGKTGSTISISSQKYDVIISDKTFTFSSSGSFLNTLFDMGYKILTTGNDNTSITLSGVISTNSANGNTYWSSSINSQFINSVITSGVTGWTGDGGDSGRIILTIPSGASGVYFHSTTGVNSPSVVIKENNVGGKWIHFQDGYIYSRGSASALLNNAMRYLTQDTQKNYVLSDIGLVVCPNYKFQERQTLVGEWKFNETSGSTAYDSGYFSSISANNFVLTNASFTAGYVGNGLYFNPSLSGSGTTDINNLLKLNLSAFTISFLYKPTLTGQNQYLLEGLYGKPLFGIDGTQRLYLQVRDPSDTFYVTYSSTAQLIYNEWNWVGVTWNPSASSVSFYRNGIHASTFSTSGSIGGSQPTQWRIGGRNNVIVGGIYDMIKIMNRPLTLKDMENLWLADTSLSTGNVGLTGVTITPYNELNIYSTIESNDLNYTNNVSSFVNKNTLNEYLPSLTGDSFGPLITKVLYLDENMNVLMTGTPSQPIKKHDKLPTTINTKIIL